MTDQPNPADRQEFRAYWNSPDIACWSKDAMPREVAVRIAHKMRRQGKKVRVYHCAYCHGWHVGGTRPGKSHRRLK